MEKVLTKNICKNLHYIKECPTFKLIIFNKGNIWNDKDYNMDIYEKSAGCNIGTFFYSSQIDTTYLSTDASNSTHF